MHTCDINRVESPQILAERLHNVQFSSICINGYMGSPSPAQAVKMGITARGGAGTGDVLGSSSLDCLSLIVESISRTSHNCIDPSRTNKQLQTKST
uniref:Uncharacterized protein n=1 Tax=Timema monikensis TaxID=170555 RepID=A0A7R9EEW2_9NEOP|nr:unnamed protein product [Timema monikensis]